MPIAWIMLRIWTCRAESPAPPPAEPVLAVAAVGVPPAAASTVAVSLCAIALFPPGLVIVRCVERAAGLPPARACYSAATAAAVVVPTPAA
jgi:hypothetical protein